MIPTEPSLASLRQKHRHSLYRRLLKNFVFTSLFLLISLFIGMWGYHHLAKLSWIDSFLNASMILAGMGPVAPLESDASKIFAGCYALYSGGAFLVAMAVLLAPILHYFLKSFEFKNEVLKK